MESLQVGQYILEDKLGEGGMAEVWKARNVVLGNSVAIKFLNPRLAGHPEIEQRFLGEGKRQANLQHPGIVSAFDFLYVDGRSYLIMRYVKGESLEDRLFRLRAPMPLQAVLSISNDVLGALEYAHSERVIHRDIKPSNILLENSGRALVLDFGIAVVLGEQRVTRAGIAVGTPHYMSPEQIVGAKQFDHRSDIYSYGCVLYQMLTERPPFDAEEGEGDTEFFVKNQHVNRPPQPPRELNPDIPVYIEQAVLRCLEKNPADRFDSCKDLMDALSKPPASRFVAAATVLESPVVPAGAWRTQVDIPAQVPQTNPGVSRSTVTPPPTHVTTPPVVIPVSVPAPVRDRKPLWAVAAVVAVLALGGGGYYWYSRPAAQPEQAVVVPPTVEPKKDTPVVQPPPVVKPPVKRAQADTKQTKVIKSTLPTHDEEGPPIVVPPQLPPKTAPTPIPTPVRLPYSGGPVQPHGIAEFHNLPSPVLKPGEHVRYNFDHAAWRAHMGHDQAGKFLVLESLLPSAQTPVVTWEVGLF